ncbi:hypothetical protein BG011_009916 [Mortierella polycephala]|uniref:Ion transport domain-containing protein n=1 Tax=Mortierella polycephala TaxID=41804 RepID=A0A9P6PM63_9FUNG|nr:hypothetical protein BG011_009916 [Mortierella polycephala]
MGIFQHSSASTAHCTINVPIDSGASSSTDIDRPQDTISQNGVQMDSDQRNAVTMNTAVVYAATDNNAISDSEDDNGSVARIPVRVDNLISSSDDETRWYFYANPDSPYITFLGLEGKNAMQPDYLCSKSYHPSVRIDATKPSDIMWHMDMDDYNPGLYNIILGISTRDLIVDNIKFLRFVVIPNSRLKLMCKPESSLSQWKLNIQVERARISSLSIRMVLSNYSLAGSGDLNAGFLDLHFIELRASPIEGIVGDSSLTVHQPFVWSVDLRQKHHDLADLDPEEGAMRLIHHAISGDGNYVATLASTTKRVILDLWDVTAIHTITRALTSGAGKGKQSDPASILPRRCATTSFAMERIEAVFHWDAMVSVSWDGTQVALVDTAAVSDFRKQQWRVPSQFAIYNYSGGCRSSSRPLDLQPSRNFQHCVSLQNLFAYGRFHIPATENQDVQDEVFVACDGQSILVYKVFGKWTQLHTISLFEAAPNSNHSGCYHACRLAQSLQGRYLVWVSDDKDVASVWDITDGLLVSSVSTLTQSQQSSHGNSMLISAATFSSDSSVMAIAVEGAIMTYKTLTGDFLGYWPVSVDYPDIVNLQFLRDDTQILIGCSEPYENRLLESMAFILDAITFAPIDAFTTQGPYTYIPQPHSHNPYFYTIHGSLFELIQIQDYVLKSYSQPRVPCIDPREDEPTPLRDRLAETTALSGLHFKVEMHVGHSERNNSVFLTATDENGASQEYVIIPPSKFGELGSRAEHATFLNGGSRLLVSGWMLNMVWSLPATLEGDVNLLLVWVLATPELNGPTLEPQDLLRISDTRQAFFGSTLSAFEIGILLLIPLFKKADGFETFQQTVLRYLSSYLDDLEPDNPSKCVMGILIDFWRKEDDAAIEGLMSALLDHRCNRWVPKRETILQYNPVKVIVQEARAKPQAMVLAMIFINYCVARFRTSQDTQYLYPIMDCFDDLVDLRRRHSNLALSILRRIAFVPYMSRSFVLKNHIICHPPEFRWQFWKPVSRHLMDYKNPVLQLSSRPRDNLVDDGFTQDFFEARFEFLWTAMNGPTLGTRPNSQRRQEPISKIRVLAYVILSKFKLGVTKTVKCHDFSLEMLDNPMIAAMVEYKWSVYNAIDLAVFVLPMAGSINQMLIHFKTITGRTSQDGHAEFFSFSILLIGLHFGGRYDSIDADFESGNWAFLTMMILFFFFTVILMLNVLIALINVAFNDGDTTWRQEWLKNRLWFIEHAENLSLEIPGFREAYEWFPDKIYYTASAKEVEDYKARFGLRKDDEKSVKDK